MKSQIIQNPFSDKLAKKWISFGPETEFFFCVFLKNAPEYIDPSGHLIFYEIFCSSNFLFY